MTSLDAVFIVIFVVFFIRGIWTGVVSQMAFLSALLIGFIAAGSLYEKAAPHMQDYISPPQLAFFATFTLLFVLVYIIVMVIGMSLKRVVKVSSLGWFDRLMGGMLGLGKAVLISTFIFIALTSVLSKSNSFVRKAYFYPFFKKSSKGVLRFVKDKDLREHFNPKDPGIASLLALQSKLAKRTKERVLESNKEKLEDLREQLAREARERMAKTPGIDFD